jgi:acetylornithine/succinyldiaminopimelate/putrescine aminotransferase
VNDRELFLRYLAQTSPSPLALQIVRAEGCSLFDEGGKEYLDLVGGISVANVGHRHPRVIDAIKKQLDAYLHIMVYGEFIESPQVHYAEMLAKNLPSNLSAVYFTNSGAEAIEGAMKLAKRFTGRTDILAFNKSYHGSTQGALSLIGDEYWRNAYRPLLPGIHHANYNSFKALEYITEQTACVVIEPVQAEAGIIAPLPEWIVALKKKCDKTGTLLIFDEIQTGFGRTGKLWGFHHFEYENISVIPDILVLGKALGGGMPLGAFIASKEMMNVLTDQPVLGHITTFGGHPVSCAAGLAAFNVLIEEKLVEQVKEKENHFRSIPAHRQIKFIRSYGLWLAIQFDSAPLTKRIIDYCISKGVITDWFLFNDSSLRISPPLTISHDEINKAITVIFEAINSCP